MHHAHVGHLRAAFILWVPRVGVTVTPYVGRIESKPKTWYKKFDLVVAGLDNQVRAGERASERAISANQLRQQHFKIW